MNVLVPTIGSRGDVQPFIALAQGLNQRGHKATIASHPVMRELVESHGVMFQPIGPDIDLAEKVAEITQSSRSSVAGLMRAMRFSFDMLREAHEDILALGENSDLMVVSGQSAAGKNEADLLGLPYLSVTLMPWAIPYDDPERSILRRTFYAVIDDLVGLITTRPLNRIRKEVDLAPVGREGFTSLRLNLIPVSPHVFEPNPNWEHRHRIVGYWFADEPAHWEPPSRLVNFIEGGDPPILICLGAMVLGERNPTELAVVLADGIREAGFRAVIQGFGNAIDGADPGPSILFSEPVPHSWLLPKCSAVVHHGGFGTTAAGLRAGKPAVIVPHIADQFFWAKIVQELGVGAKPIPRSKLNTNSLASAVSTIKGDDNLRRRADDLGRQIRSETGVELAVDEVEKEFGQG